jgi:hypothetical protein
LMSGVWDALFYNSFMACHYGSIIPQKSSSRDDTKPKRVSLPSVIVPLPKF